MGQSAVLSTILIEDNFIEAGIDVVGGVNTPYAYDAALFTTADAQIRGNTFSGVNASQTMLVVFGCNCVITNNFFIRNTTALNNYIGILGSFGQIITHNFFDSSFSSGTNEVLVSGLTSDTIFRENKNQIGYAAAYISELNDFSTGNGVSDTLKPYISDDGTVSSSVSGFLILTSNTLLISFQGDITKYLPDGVQVLYTVLGFSLFSSTTTVNTGTTNTTSYHIFSDQVSNFSTASPPASFAGSLADNIANAYTTGAITVPSNTLSINAGNVAAFHTTTQYMFTDLTSSGFITGQNYRLNINLEGNFTASGAGGMDVVYSPLLIKYRW